MSAGTSSDLTNELPAGYRLEEFEIKSVLGSGGFGITYLAYDVDLKRDVVIKENLPFQCAVRDSTRSVRPRTSASGDRDQFQWALDSFMREAETLSRFDHPNIVRILRRFEANNTAYFVMPYLPGKSFKQVIDEQVAREEAFTESKLKDLLHPLLDALQTLHAEGVYHRDIKAANILLVTGHKPILIDFGAARLFISEKSHTVVESAGYTPFEQLQSHGNVGPWSDIYALGGTFYTAIHGQPPPRASDRIRRDPIVNLAKHYSDVYSKPFLEALDWSLKVDETERPQSVAEWRQALDATASQTHVVPPLPKPEPKPVPAPAPLPPLKPESKPFPVMFALQLGGFVAGALLLLALAWHFVWPFFAKPGSLAVTSDPSNAQVHIWGQTDQPTPAQFPQLRPGHYQVTISAPGYDSAIQSIEIKSGEAFSLPAVHLKRTLGGLNLTTIPPHLSYRLSGDGNDYRGTTPAILSDLPIANYQLTLSGSGLDSQTVDIDVIAHQTTKTTLDLIKLNVSHDASPKAKQALLGQTPPGQLDDATKKEYIDLLNQAFGAYVHHNLFSQAAALFDPLKKMGQDTTPLERMLDHVRDNYEQSVTAQIKQAIANKKFGTARSKLKAVADTGGKEMADRLAAQFQGDINTYAQQVDAAVKQAQNSSPADGYTSLKAFADRYPDDVTLQLALAHLLTRMPPDHTRLSAQISAFKNFDQQDLGVDEAADFQTMQAKVQNELATYDQLLAKLNKLKGDPAGRANRIASLQNEIARDERKIAEGDGVNQAVNAVTGIFGAHVRVDTVGQRRQEIARDQAEIAQLQQTSQASQADIDAAQKEFDTFCATVPW